MKIRRFLMRLCAKEGLKKQVDIAQMGEIYKAIREELLERLSLDLSRLIRLLPDTDWTKR